MLELNAAEAILLAAVGTGAGIINTLAGGGMLLTVPAMIFLGIPETMANGTSRLGIIFQTGASTWAYWRAGALDTQHLRLLLPPALVGAILGSAVGATLPDTTFRSIFGVIMLVVAALLVIRPERYAERDGRTQHLPRLKSLVVMFAIGLYGGMIQAGTGYVVLAGLTLILRMGLVETNILKPVLIGAYTPIAIAIFAWHGQISFCHGACLAVGQVVGSLIGAHLTLTRGARSIRYALLASVSLGFLELAGWLDTLISALLRAPCTLTGTLC